jgi:uncharacterized protein (UPF0248 family)
MKPFHEIVSRIRHTAALDPSDFTVGYEDRLSDSRGRIRETSLAEFLAAGEIPEHRVRFVKDRDGRVVWDRERRICEL